MADSSFTTTYRGLAQGGWMAAGTWPTKFYGAKRNRTAGQKVGGGCISFLIFGIAFIFVPMILMLFVEAGLVVYASVLTLAWGIGAAVDSARAGRKQISES